MDGFGGGVLRKAGEKVKGCGCECEARAGVDS